MMCDGTTPLILAGHGVEGFPDPIWPVNFFDLNRYFPYTGFQNQQPEENLAPMGIFPIHPGEKPEADVVEPAEPILVEGIGYVQQYTGRPYTEEEAVIALANAKQSLMWRLDSCLQATYDRGWEFTHGEEVNTFSLTSDNRQLVGAIYQLAKEETNAERIFRMRTFDSQIIECSIDEIKVLGKGMAEYVVAVLDKLWDLTDHVNKATKISDLPVIPDFIEIEQ